MVKAIIFDCFGVLVGKGFEYTYRLAGGDPQKDRVFIEETLNRANWGLISGSEFDLAMARKAGISKNEWQAAVNEAEQPDVELLNYIQELRVDYKTAVLSNANRGTFSRKDWDHWFEKCFDEIVVSGEIGMVKPDPAIYRYVASRLGVRPSECVFIDDHKVHLDGAREVGMLTVFYQDLQQMKRELQKILAA